jgi:hypothetical protein
MARTTWRTRSSVSVWVEEAVVGHAEHRRGEAEAGGENGAEAGAFGEAGAERVVGAGENDDLVAVEHAAEGGGGAHGGLLSHRAAGVSAIDGLIRPRVYPIDFACHEEGAACRLIVSRFP